jgi:cell division protein FtsQ
VTKEERYNTGLLIFLVICAVVLSARIVYLFLVDEQRFPINTVKIAANYQHITRKQLETTLAGYLNASFFALPVGKLQKDLSALDWAKEVTVDRIWPDTIKITVVEKLPFATWNDGLLTAEGEVFIPGESVKDLNIPHLYGPKQQQKDVLQNYQKLSKLLATFGLKATVLELRENQAWELTLSNGVEIHLGKRDLENRLERFCKAYQLVLVGKSELIQGVDLRYAHGMAVQWKQQMGR